MRKAGDFSVSVNAIKNCTGKTLVDINRVQTYINDEENEGGFGDLELTFSDGTYLTLSGTGDAQSINAVNQKAGVPQKFNIADDRVMSWKKLSLLGLEEWSRLIKQTLINADIDLMDEDEDKKKMLGCTLYFDTDFITFYETAADEAQFFVNVPMVEFGMLANIETLL